MNEMEAWEQTFMAHNTTYTVSVAFRDGANPLHNDRSVANNDDIDESRTQDNVVIVDRYKDCKTFRQRDREHEKILIENTNIEKYVEQFNERQYKNNHYDRLTSVWDELHKKHTTFMRDRNDNRIVKKSIQEHELIFQIGNMKNHINDKNLSNEILQKCFDDFRKENPNAIITQAIIHNDEATPHLHICFFTCVERTDKRNNLKLDFSFNTYVKGKKGFVDFRNNCIDNLERNASMENVKAIYQQENNKRIENIHGFKEIKKRENQQQEKNIERDYFVL